MCLCVRAGPVSYASAACMTMMLGPRGRSIGSAARGRLIAVGAQYWCGGSSASVAAARAANRDGGATGVRRQLCIGGVRDGGGGARAEGTPGRGDSPAVLLS